MTNETRAEQETPTTRTFFPFGMKKSLGSRRVHKSHGSAGPLLHALWVAVELHTRITRKIRLPDSREPTLSAFRQFFVPIV